jgi:hypothetical protein
MNGRKWMGRRLRYVHTLWMGDGAIIDLIACFQIWNVHCYTESTGPISASLPTPKKNHGFKCTSISRAKM